MRALREGWIAGAGLDVFEREPALTPGLADLPQRGARAARRQRDAATRDAMAEIAAANIVAALRARRFRTGSSETEPVSDTPAALERAAAAPVPAPRRRNRRGGAGPVEARWRGAPFARVVRVRGALARRRVGARGQHHRHGLRGPELRRRRRPDAGGLGRSRHSERPRRDLQRGGRLPRPPRTTNRLGRLHHQPATPARRPCASPTAPSRRPARAAARREPVCRCRPIRTNATTRHRRRRHRPRRRREPGADRRRQRRGRHDARVAHHRRRPRPQSITTVVVAANGTDVPGVDFGFNFDTIVNTTDTGQGSLRQFVVNANALTGEGGLAQAGLTAGLRGLDLHDPERGREPGPERRLRQPADRGPARTRARRASRSRARCLRSAATNTILDGRTQTTNVRASPGGARDQPVPDGGAAAPSARAGRALPLFEPPRGRDQRGGPRR